MPRLVPQSEKSKITVSQQPQHMTSKIQVLIMMDIGGADTNYMSDILGISKQRISVIKNSPMYEQQKSHKLQELESEVLAKQSDRIASGDPVDTLIKSHCLDAVNEKITLMKEAQSEMVRNSAASDILDRGGYKPHTARTSVTIEVTEKMSDRFDKVLRYSHSEVHDGK
ncbi:hypothetical protein LCGC14_3024680 [marine sediment metagenome]|uniref:Uncharacterized protein n=1 Tax=marine sediment metagenome TaxID=412755 RepID=A0A0F8ZKE7_9ZZZZ